MNGILFGNKHSYDDWGLILKSRPVISPPEPKTNYIDIPEADGQLDLTESLSGEVRFNNRDITFEFNVIDARQRWSSLYSEIANYLHGQKLKIIFDEDPYYYYMGRFKIDEWESDKRTSVLTITGSCDPYKYDIIGSLDDWIWDDFNFETGIIRDYSEIVVDGTLDFIVLGTRRHAVPTFEVHSSDGQGMKVKYGVTTYDLADGKNRVVTINIKDGENHLEFTGHGTVAIDYRGGSL